uniref:Cytochrome c oxidase subunit 3 n=1 Tax=Ophiophthalmus serratus TaxID=2993811 RepID=A0A9E8IDD7_9ECHI|nr:cytochrome c oxidase subunit III [Ophiophthalmus serratus]UZG65884.1 cytochrome c oxidase subunit 3 [Ophiophthalmus serratus]
MTNINHPFHMVENSPWPMVSSIAILTTIYGLISIFQNHNSWIILVGLLLMINVFIIWWRDVIREATFLGLHTNYVTNGIKIGFILFIISEIMFFLSFFWAFFHSSLAPVPEIGVVWPPSSVVPINPWGIPLLNTAILLSSGGSLTWSHHSLCQNNTDNATNALLITILLGIWFTLLQGYEYWETSFTIADNVYGNTFFVTTGFHGLHVIIGTTFLTICILRIISGHLSNTHHIGYECAIWYWHFVDVVWILLFICLYWWGGS